MSQHRYDESTSEPSRIDSFSTDDDGLVIYDREAMDAWLKSDHCVPVVD